MTTVICPYCSKAAALVDGKTIYPHRDDLVQKSFWLCEADAAYVGCHEGTDKPLGRLANAELRRAKMDAHKAFDPVWRSEAPRDRHKARSNAYQWLSRMMELPPEETHIGMMDVAQCKRVVQLCIELHRASTTARRTENTF